MSVFGLRCCPKNALSVPVPDSTGDPQRCQCPNRAQYITGRRTFTNFNYVPIERNYIYYYIGHHTTNSEQVPFNWYRPGEAFLS